MPDGNAWPKISVITPSYNQGQFIEETIRAVLLQGYPNLEYIIVDGGSTDNSVEVIKKYAPWLTYWTSEPDRGQAHAINKGLALATGHIFNWINSDDLLTPNALATVAMASKNVDVVAGGCVNFTQGVMQNETLIFSSGLIPYRMIKDHARAIFQQPAFWITREGVAQCGGIDERFHYAFDWDLALRYLCIFPRVAYVPAVLARFRLHESSKTVSQSPNWEQEKTALLQKLLKLDQFNSLHKSCELRLRQLSWWATLKRLKTDTSMSCWQRIFRMFLSACLDPRIRWTRATLGAVRRTLAGIGD